MILKPPKGAMLNRGHPLARGLKGAWILNEGGGNVVADLSGNGNTGTLVANAYSAGGKFGPCVSFDGTGDYISLKNTYVFPTVFSASIWFYADSDLTIRMMMGYTADSGNYIALWSPTSIYVTLTTTSKIFTVPTVSAGVWYHIAITKDASNNVRCYLNGVESSTGALNDDHTLTIDAIGKGYNNTSYDWMGDLDMPAIYNRALSPIEIAYLYRNPFCMFEVDL